MYGLGISSPIMENQMEKNMDDSMQSGIMLGFTDLGFPIWGDYLIRMHIYIYARIICGSDSDHVGLTSGNLV